MPIGDDKLEEVYNDIMKFNMEQINKCEGNALVVAAVLMAQALSIYKTVLSHNEFDTVVDGILDTKDKVKRWNMQVVEAPDPSKLH